MSMKALNQRKKAPSSGNLRRLRAASAMHPAPVQTLEKRGQLRCCQAHHAIPDTGHLKPLCSSFFAIRHRPVPSHQTSLIRSARLARNT